MQLGEASVQTKNISALIVVVVYEVNFRTHRDQLFCSFFGVIGNRTNALFTRNESDTPLSVYKFILILNFQNEF